MLKHAFKRLVARIAVVVIPAGTLVAVMAAPALAYSCTNGQGILITQSQNLSSANVTFYPKCSDNRAHFSGWIHDIACDNRAGRLVLEANGYFYPDGYRDEWGHVYNASNGCGTTTTFSGTDVALTSPWQFTIDVGACSITCSSYTERTLYG